MRNLSIRTRLGILVMVAVLAVVVAAVGGWVGLRAIGSTLSDVTQQQMPGLVGLQQVRAGQAQVIEATLEVALKEQDMYAQEFFKNLMASKDRAWKEIDAGWKAYLTLLSSRDTITSVQNRKMVVTAKFTGPAQIEKQGAVAESNRYTWIVKVPVEVRYLPSDNSGQSLTQEGVVTLYIVRVPLATNQRGYAVWLYQFDTSKK